MQQKKRLTRRERRRRRFIRKLKAYTLAAVITIAGTTVLIVAANRDDKEKQEQTAAVPIVIEMKQPEEPIFPHGVPMYATYDYPFNTMSQDWSAEDVEGFCYHEISGEAKAAGGQFPVIAQVYTYIVCKNYGVDYEVVFALIEKESGCRWELVGDAGESFGYMQIMGRCHTDRMQKLGVTSLTNPFDNIRVGVDYLAELKEKTDNDMDMLAAYNYGLTGAKTKLWANGVHEYSYNKAIVERAQQLKKEKEEMKEQCGG